MARELTREEKAAIRSLVVKWCANYDRACGCLPLDSESYMLGKCWTGAYCPICGGAVAPDRRQAYCSEACALKAHRRQQREYMRRKRG